ncbi:MAG: C40 family peptidase [Candidatus Kryptoniota bacterium]
MKEPNTSSDKFLNVIPNALASLLAIVLISCASSTPRFTSVGKEPVKFSPRFTDQTPEELNRERLELLREDDHKVTTEKMKSEINRLMTTRHSLNGKIQEKLVQMVLSFMATPYKIGGIDHSGIDCSGLTMVVFDSVFNYELPHSSREQAQLGLSVGRDELQVGDLVFFRTIGRRISHVGIYFGDNLFAHASVEQGVTISSLESTYYAKRYAGARRIVSFDSTALK